MRKQTKLAVGVSAAALLAVGASMTAFAAIGWVNEGGSWKYYNASGDVVEDQWKSYNGQYFYLGDDGVMLTNQLVEDGDNHYYVDANGAMVKNTWVAVPKDDNEDLDVEFRWYYFGSTGKAYKSSFGKTINGKKYGFDDDGKMLFGYVEDASYNIINDDDDPILSATYYYGTNEDGARHTGWLKYTDALTDKDWDYYWFYFNTSNGKKVSGQSKNINGKKYVFDSVGVMQKEWAEATIGDGTTTTWFNSLADGSLGKNEWIWNKPYADVTIPGNKDAYNNEDKKWFRTDASGKLVKNQTKKINSKWYVFDADGVMLHGLVVLNNTEGAVSGSKPDHWYDMDEVTVNTIENGTDGKALHYFSGDEEHDGSMKTGTMAIELADDTKTFCFTKTTGAAKVGYDSSSKKIYKNGILQKAGDDKYKVVSYDHVLYLVGTTGNVVTSVNKYKDANDKYYIFLGKDANGSAIVGWTYDEDAAKNAVKAKRLDVANVTPITAD